MYANLRLSENPRDGDEQNRQGNEPAPTPDLISTLAKIGAPLYVVIRIGTGGWTTALFFLLILFLVEAFYFWMFSAVPADDGQ